MERLDNNSSTQLYETANIPAELRLETPIVPTKTISDAPIFQARIKFDKGFSRFRLVTPNLTGQHYRMMKMVLRIKYKTGHLVYRARPYKSKINDMKIYYDRSVDRIHRCQIKDMYTKLKDKANTLAMKATILKIDRSIYVFDVDFDSLYDYPQIISAYQDIEPESKVACLGIIPPHLISELHCDVYREINEHFFRYIKNNTIYKVKILEQYGDVYHVDVFNKNGFSLVDHISHIIKIRLELCRAWNKPPVFRVGNIKYNGALDYFRLHVNKLKFNQSSSLYLERSLCKVRVLSWFSPEDIYIIPDDDQFFEGSKDFKERIRSIQPPFHSIATNHTYKKNDPCFFKNRISTEWLRGEVIFVSENSHKTEDIGSEKIFYRVKSIDYGFQVVKTGQDLRRVEDNIFFLHESWALRCSLFGIYPRDQISFEDGIDAWFSAKGSPAHILFRSRIPDFDATFNNPPVCVTLFHRVDHYEADENRPIIYSLKPRYDCLNTHLIEQGYATDFNEKNKETSNIFLDRYAVDLIK